MRKIAVNPGRLLALRRLAGHPVAMLNLFSILVGILVFFGAIVGFIPLFGWFNWFLIPVALFGLVLGTLSSHRSRRNLNLVLLVFCALRLMLGHGVI